MRSERFFLRSPNINVCFRIIIDAKIDKSTFEEAIGNVCKRHPFLNCSIEIDDDNNAFYIPNNCKVAIEYYQSEEMPDWQIWHTKSDGIPFDFIAGPMARICVIVDNKQTEIIVLGHHIIGDGIGYLNLSRDILLALDNKLDTTAQIPPPNNEFIKENKLGLLQYLFAKILNKEWEKTRFRFSEEEYQSFFLEYRKNFTSAYYFNTIAEKDLIKIKEMCKEENISVNEIFSAAFARAFYTGKDIRVGIAVNTRSELKTKPHDCMCNYLSGVLAKIKLSPKNDFTSDIKKVAKLTRKQLNNINKRHLVVNFLNVFDNDLIESIMYASYGNFKSPVSKKIGSLISKKSDKKTLGITNLGSYELNNYDSFKLLDMQFIAPALPSNILSVCVITVNNKLNICLRYNLNELDTNNVINIYNKAISFLF